MIELPNQSQSDYLAAFGATAIYVASGFAGKPSVITSTRDISRSLAMLRRRWSQMIDCTHAVWLADRANAVRIVGRVYRGKRCLTRIISADAQELAQAIEQAADDLGVTLTDHETAMMRARIAVDRINRTLADAQARGDLRFFNRAYAAHRAAAAAQGRACMRYPLALARLRYGLARQLATIGTVDLAEKNLLIGIFGKDQTANKAPSIKHKSQRRTFEPLDKRVLIGT
jgi:hypothetical protein